MALYILGYVSYGATLVFYAALFPRLARNTRRSRHLRQEYEEGKIEREEYEREESLEKNRISNISTVSHPSSFLHLAGVPRIYIVEDEADRRFD